MNQLVHVNTKHPQITILTLQRAEKRNALNSDMMKQISQAIDEASNNANQRVLILRGDGPVFCSGMDLLEASDSAQAETTTSLVMQMLKKIYTTHLITIAAVHGSAMAAGAGITAACDFVIAEEGCKFGFPETSRGLVPAVVMCYLIRQIPYRTVREMVLLGETFDAERALSWGFINRVILKDELEVEALNLAHIILSRAPLAIVKTKQLLEKVYPGNLDEDIKGGLAVLQSTLNSEESLEGVKAFLEKRAPKWGEQ